VSSLAFRLALAAEGRFDAMLTLRDAWEWDIAAGALIVTEAGGAATTRDGAALRFNNPLPKVAGVVAGTPGVHAGLLTRLA
jgi:myo-inositol-1(or 4)-monophosphatase